MQYMQDFLDKTDDAVDDADPIEEEKYLGNSYRVVQQGSSRTLISPWAMGGGLAAAMSGSGPQTEIELGKYMVDFFNHLHPIDYFYPGQAPLPGTLLCHFCRRPMVLGTAARHARSCAKAEVLEKARSLLSTQFPILQRCSWMQPSGQVCNKGPFTSHCQAAKHIFRHITSKVNGGSICRLSPCNQQVQPVDFKDKTSLRQHQITVHRIAGVQQETKGGMSSYVRWCGLCGRYLCQLDEDLDLHNAQHEELIGEIIRTEGFLHLKVGQLEIRPWLNPFEIYDVSLPPSARFHLGYNTLVDIWSHMESYLSQLDDKKRYKCPASADAGSYITAVCGDKSMMSIDELRSHVQNAHGLKKPTGGRGKKNAVEANLGDGEAPKAKRSRKSRKILQPTSTNPLIDAAMKLNASAYLTEH